MDDWMGGFFQSPTSDMERAIRIGVDPGGIEPDSFNENFEYRPARRTRPP